MNLYILLDLFVLAAPLALSFDKKVAFYRRWPSVSASIAIILVLFGAWDIGKTALGVWSFDARLAGETRILLLPIGEWLFFICVPYACIFILACLRAYLCDASFRMPRALPLTVGALLAVGGILSLRLTYTGVVLIASGAVLAGAELLSPSSLRSRTFWIALGITYIPFMIANGILTGLPVVIYDDSRNLGIRVGSIPVEDFFFSFAMLVASFIAFDGFESRRGRVSEPSPAQLESGRPRGAGDAP